MLVSVSGLDEDDFVCVVLVWGLSYWDELSSAYIRRARGFVECMW